MSFSPRHRSCHGRCVRCKGCTMGESCDHFNPSGGPKHPGPNNVAGETIPDCVCDLFPNWEAGGVGVGVAVAAEGLSGGSGDGGGNGSGVGGGRKARAKKKKKKKGGGKEEKLRKMIEREKEGRKGKTHNGLLPAAIPLRGLSDDRCGAELAATFPTGAAVRAMYMAEQQAAEDQGEGGVHRWLEEQGKGNLAPAFIGDGYDSLGKLSMMDRKDIRSIAGMKTSYLKPMLKAVKELRGTLARQPSSTGRGGDPLTISTSSTSSTRAGQVGERSGGAGRGIDDSGREGGGDRGRTSTSSGSSYSGGGSVGGGGTESNSPGSSRKSSGPPVSSGSSGGMIAAARWGGADEAAPRGGGKDDGEEKNAASRPRVLMVVSTDRGGNISLINRGHGAVLGDDDIGGSGVYRGVRSGGGRERGKEMIRSRSASRSRSGSRSGSGAGSGGRPVSPPGSGHGTGGWSGGRPGSPKNRPVSPPGSGSGSGAGGWGGGRPGSPGSRPGTPGSGGRPMSAASAGRSPRSPNRPNSATVRKRGPSKPW